MLSYILPAFGKLTTSLPCSALKLSYSTIKATVQFPLIMSVRLFNQLQSQ